MKDLYHNLQVVQALAPAAVTATVTPTTNGVDLSGYEAALVVINPGVRTDGTHTPKLSESVDNLSDWTDVAAGDLIGSFVAITSNAVQKVGYIGSKRYIQLTVTVSGATTGAVYGATVELGHARHNPVGVTQAP